MSKQKYIDDLNSFLNDGTLRELTQNVCYSVARMTNQEVMESIVGDILTVTVLEKKSNQELAKGAFNLTKFIITMAEKERCLTLLLRESVQQFLELNNNHEYRVKADKLKEAMDFSGIFWDI